MMSPSPDNTALSGNQGAAWDPGKLVAELDERIPADCLDRARVLLDQVFAALDASREHLVVLAFDRSRQVIGHEVVASGNNDLVSRSVDAAFRAALFLDAWTFIVARNYRNSRGSDTGESLLDACSFIVGCNHLSGSQRASIEGEIAEWQPILGGKWLAVPLRFNIRDLNDNSGDKS